MASILYSRGTAVVPSAMRTTMNPPPPMLPAPRFTTASANDVATWGPHLPFQLPTLGIVKTNANIGSIVGAAVNDSIDKKAEEVVSGLADVDPPDAEPPADAPEPSKAPAPVDTPESESPD